MTSHVAPILLARTMSNTEELGAVVIHAEDRESRCPITMERFVSAANVTPSLV
jgi:SUMO ligase MMS21 Smc5/6 complex component